MPRVGEGGGGEKMSRDGGRLGGRGRGTMRTRGGGSEEEEEESARQVGHERDIELMECERNLLEEMGNGKQEQVKRRREGP